jgi:hypothetical protein
VITSPIRPPIPTGTGHRCREPARPPKDALRRFTLVRNHNASTASSRPPPRKPASQTSRQQAARSFRAAPLPHRCWIPPVRAPSQDFHLRSQRHARHTRSALRAFAPRERPVAPIPSPRTPSTHSHTRWTNNRGPVTGSGPVQYSAGADKARPGVLPIAQRWHEQLARCNVDHEGGRTPCEYETQQGGSM